MAKNTFLFKQSINKMLKLIEETPLGQSMPNDMELTKILSVSRTTVRACVDHLIDNGIVKRQGANKNILRQVTAADYFEVDETKPNKDAEFERFFLNLIHTGKLVPGDKFSELSLAKQSGCTTITVREFLIKFSNNGLINKIPRGRWQMVEFDEQFAKELVAFRELVEMKAISQLLHLPKEDPVWDELKSCLEKHIELRDNFDSRYLEFPDADRQLHLIVQSALNNRFTSQFSDIVSFVCHYHYQWDKMGEKERFEVAVNEHIALLNALLTRDTVEAIKAMEVHLNTAKVTLLRSVHGLEA